MVVSWLGMSPLPQPPSNCSTLSFLVACIKLKGFTLSMPCRQYVSLVNAMPFSRTCVLINGKADLIRQASLNYSIVILLLYEGYRAKYCMESPTMAFLLIEFLLFYVSILGQEDREKARVLSFFIVC